jgi:hypothetical protein
LTFLPYFDKILTNISIGIFISPKFLSPINLNFLDFPSLF